MKDTPPGFLSHYLPSREKRRARGRQAPASSRPAPSPAIERRHFSTDLSTGADSRRGTRPGGAQASGTARRRDGPRAISSGGAATPNETSTAGTRRSGTRRGGRRSPGEHRFPRSQGELMAAPSPRDSTHAGHPYTCRPGTPHTSERHRQRSSHHRWTTSFRNG